MINQRDINFQNVARVFGVGGRKGERDFCVGFVR